MNRVYVGFRWVPGNLACSQMIRALGLVIDVFLRLEKKERVCFVDVDDAVGDLDGRISSAGEIIITLNQASK